MTEAKWQSYLIREDSVQREEDVNWKIWNWKNNARELRKWQG